MRRVLMLCYHFPPVHTSGTVRNVAFATLLPRHGWEPTVLTVRYARDRWSARGGVPPAGVAVVRTAEWDLSGLIELLHGSACRVSRWARRQPPRNYLRQVLGFPDPQIAWMTTVSGIRLARRHDVVYASCSPFSSALSALAIGAVARKPVVVDFRDPWCYDLASELAGWYRRAITALEAVAVRRCDRLVVNTESARHLYEGRYPDSRAKLCVVPNGYDRLTPVSALATDRFRIVHVGTLYGGRDPRPLLEALLELRDPRVELVHMGEMSTDLDAYSGRLSIRQLGIRPREEALREMQGAALLYLRQVRSNAVAVAAKTYEYLATGLPILYHGPDGENARLVREHGANSAVVVSDDVCQLAEAVRGVLDRWPNITPAITDTFRTRYDRDVLAGELSEVLASAVE